MYIFLKKFRNLGY